MIQPFVNDKKWGYRDGDKVIIPCKYEKAQPYNDGIAWVRCNACWGAINLAEEVVIPFMYHTVERIFPDRYLVSMTGAKFGLVNANGMILLQPEYDDIHLCGWGKDCFVLRKGSLYGLAYAEREVITPLIYQYIDEFMEVDILACIREDGTDLYNLAGECLLRYDGDLEYARKNGGYYRFRDTQTGRYEVYDGQGNCVYQNKGWNAAECGDYLLVTEQKGVRRLYNPKTKEYVPADWLNDYSTIGCEGERGLYLVVTDKNGNVGVLDRQGKVLIPCEYGEEAFYGVQYHSPDLFILIKDGKYGILNTKNQSVLPFEYDFIYFAEEDLIYLSKNGKKLMLNLCGDVIVPDTYDDFTRDFPNVFTVIKGEDKMLLDIHGKKVTNTIFCEIRSIESDNWINRSIPTHF
jgi:hypothetical protein